MPASGKSRVAGRFPSEVDRRRTAPTPCRRSVRRGHRPSRVDLQASRELEQAVADLGVEGGKREVVGPEQVGLAPSQQASRAGAGASPGRRPEVVVERARAAVGGQERGFPRGGGGADLEQLGRGRGRCPRSACWSWDSSSIRVFSSGAGHQDLDRDHRLRLRGSRPPSRDGPRGPCDRPKRGSGRATVAASPLWRSTRTGRDAVEGQTLAVDVRFDQLPFRLGRRPGRRSLGRARPGRR